MNVIRRSTVLAVLTTLMFCTVLAQQAKPGLLSGDDLKQVVPKDYFFRGLSATVQLRNSAGILSSRAQRCRHAPTALDSPRTARSLASTWARTMSSAVQCRPLT